MRKKTAFIFFAILLILFIIPSALYSKVNEERRIKQGKITSLQPTEIPSTYGKSPQPLPKEESEDSYFQDLLSREIAYNKDACKAIVILLGVKDTYADADSQKAFLEESKIIPIKGRGFDLEAPICKGAAAWMFCRALGIKGGLWLRFFGMSERYALRELVYEGIMPGGSTDEIVNGQELVLMLTKAAEYATEKISRYEKK